MSISPFTELAAIVGISVAAHVTIAWTAIYVHTRRAERKWTEKVEKEMIPNAASAAATQVKAALPHVPSVQELKDALPPVPPFPHVPTAAELVAAVPSLEAITAQVRQVLAETPVEVELPQGQLDKLKDDLRAQTQGIINERAAHARDALVDGAKTVASGDIAGWSRLLGVKKADLSSLGGYVQLLLGNRMGIEFVNACAAPMGWRLVRIAPDGEAAVTGAYALPDVGNAIAPWRP